MEMKTFKNFMEDHTESDEGGSIKVGQEIEYKGGPYGKIVSVDEDELTIKCDGGKEKKMKKDAFKKMLEDKKIFYVAKGHKNNSEKKGEKKKEDKKDDD